MKRTGSLAHTSHHCINHISAGEGMEKGDFYLLVMRGNGLNECLPDSQTRWLTSRQFHAADKAD